MEKKFKKPVILTDYPKGIKAFYMRMNEDGQTVRAMDILFPELGKSLGVHNEKKEWKFLSLEWKKWTLTKKNCGGI